MIEKATATHESEQESSDTINAKVSEEKEPQPCGSPNSYSVVTKSLIEDEDEDEDGDYEEYDDDDDEDDDDEDGPPLVLLSRNPSMVILEGDEEGDDGERNTTEETTMGPLSMESTTNDNHSNDYDEKPVDEEAAVGQPSYMKCAPSNMVPLCQGELPLFPGCHGQSLADHIESMSHCHPLELFSVFQEHTTTSPHEPSDHHHHLHLLPGMYMLPKSCEYCGAMETKYCTDQCQRPKSFFRKKRPPFCPHDNSKWDPTTEMVVVGLNEKQPQRAALDKAASSPASPPREQRTVGTTTTSTRSHSFLGMGDLFGKPSELSGEAREQ